ncbi:ANR family transcriptional regulator [Shewanella chilikensis]|uniref:ANR family transcriptional regulator n=1 Tax=Shewanella TaxID=22 RepID=UPI00200BA916|nr:ANR family transcriptional regulator [Shewanella chilikensis]MCL1162487.1 ANR family transcriptional regulator [Shewanella chilikensis]
MFKTNAFNENHRYLDPAVKAAELERHGNYKNAAEFWDLARQNANTFENQAWAKHRENFCRTFGRRIELANKNKQAKRAA